MKKEKSIEIIDDGLVFDEVGSWAETKHTLVSLYAKLVSTGMKDKWTNRIYIELYAGSGHGRIKGTSKFIAGSPLNSLVIEHPFSKYIFCEADSKKLEALQTRVARIAPNANVKYIEGDCNNQISKILTEVPVGSKLERTLSLCFADPYDIGIKFETFRALSVRRMDFLVLLALGMDANRNYEHYLKEDADKVDKFLGSNDWRKRWAIAQWDAVKFKRFLADEFTKSMATLGYIPPPHYTMKEVRSQEKNLDLYRLALFSRNDLAYKFWGQVLKYSTNQQSLWD